jgi:hypothetical protein
MRTFRTKTSMSAGSWLSKSAALLMVLAGLAAGGFAIVSGLADDAGDDASVQRQERAPDAAVRGQGAPASEAESLEPEEGAEGKEGVSGEIRTSGDNWKKRADGGPGLTPEDVTRVKRLIDEARAAR